MKTLAQRLMACKHFRWMPGMQIANRDDNLALTWRIVHCHTNWLTLWDERSIIERPAKALTDDDLFPDLSDPATLGCVLALVEGRYGDGCYVQNLNGGLYGDGWVVFIDDQALTERHQTRAHALVAALEAA